MIVSKQYFTGMMIASTSGCSGASTTLAGINAETEQLFTGCYRPTRDRVARFLCAGTAGPGARRHVPRCGGPVHPAKAAWSPEPERPPARSSRWHLHARRHQYAPGYARHRGAPRCAPDRDDEAALVIAATTTSTWQVPSTSAAHRVAALPTSPDLMWSRSPRAWTVRHRDSRLRWRWRQLPPTCFPTRSASETQVDDIAIQ